jgi:hypothetical protein
MQAPLDHAVQDEKEQLAGGSAWIGCLGLVAALAVFPLPTVGSTPEIDSILACSAIALLASQRWALPMVVLTDIALIGALWPRAFHDPPSMLAQTGIMLGLLGALPGIWMLRRTATPLADFIVGHASRRAQAVSRAVVTTAAVVWLGSPLFS